MGSMVGAYFGMLVSLLVSFMKEMKDGSWENASPCRGPAGRYSYSTLMNQNPK